MDPGGEKVVHGFFVQKKVGAGTFGQVFKAIDGRTQKPVALKVVKYETLKDRCWADHEVRILALLEASGAKQCIKFDRCFVKRDRLILVLEYYDFDLATLVQSATLSTCQIKSLLFQLCSALACVHACGVLHRDLKSANVLVNGNGTLCLGDFGSATFLATETRFSSHYVTLHYRPPELLKKEATYGLPVDIWSLGCIFMEVLTGHQLFRGSTEEVLMAEQSAFFALDSAPTLPPSSFGSPSPSSTPSLSDSGESTVRRPSTTPPCPLEPKVNIVINNLLAKCGEASELVQKMLQQDPSRRITAAGARDHPFFVGAAEEVEWKLNLPAGHYWEWRKSKSKPEARLPDRDASPKH